MTSGCRTVWACAGTTGYDALRHIDGLFACPQGSARLFAHYRDFVTPLADEGGDWEETVRRAAYEVVTHDLAAEVERLTRTARRISERAPRPGDHAAWALRHAIRELMVRLPVYRPYAADTDRAEQDASMLDKAAVEARTAFRVPEEARAVDLVRDLALGRFQDDPDCADFAARFAQTASALHAKSVEDTAFYRYPVLLSACEVGGDPGEPALGPEIFHAFCARTQRDRPLTGTVLSTHDTKRSADVRARIAVLSECPDRWRDVLGELSGGADGAVGGMGVDGTGPADPMVSWLAWQTAFGLGAPGGTGPAAGDERREDTAERMTPAILKAVREAGLRTSWTEQNADYESAVTDFVRSGPAGPGAGPLSALDEELAPFVRANVLGATLLHLTMPGVPDLYQGTERRYARARRSRQPGAGPLPPRPARGPRRRRRAARPLRREAAADRHRAPAATRAPEWFGEDASYEPLRAEGPAAEHCVAYCRSGRVVSVATRLSLRLVETGGWWDTALRLPSGGSWRDLLTGRTVAGGAVLGLDELLDVSPVALLVAE